MARRPSANELQNALAIEQARQQTMERPESKDYLLRLDTDEEQIALRDLSSQRSPVQTRPPPTVLTGDATTGHHSRAGSEGIRGWRPRSRGTTTERRETLTMGRLYEKMGRLSIIPRYLVYILPLAAIIAIPLTIGAVVPTATLGGVQLLWIFIWVEIVWVSLWVSKICAKCFPFFFKHLVGFVSAGTAKYATIISALEVPITLVAWTFVSFVTFIPLMTRNPHQRAIGDTSVSGWEGTLRQLLAALTVTACVYLAEKVFIQFVAVNFHKVSYEERIKKNKAAVHIIARLYEQSRALFPTFTHDFKYDDEVLMGLNEPMYMKPGHHGSRSVSGTATPTMKAVLGKTKKAVNKATSAFGSAAQEITGKQIFQPSTPYNVVVEALASSDQCTCLARRIWYSFASEGEEVMHISDFEEVLGNPEEAKEAMDLFDKDANGDVTIDEAEMVVHEVSKERKSLARSMKDVDSAIGKFDDVLIIVVFIIGIFILISFLNTNFATTLATAGTALISLSFIFALTCQEILASILFLFYKHPFDVGDRVDVNGSHYVVKELSLLFTVFKRTDGTIVQVNNATLNTLFIENIRRSATMSEKIQLQVDFGTTFYAIQKLRAEMQSFVRANSRDYASELEVEIVDARGLDKLLLQIIIKHKSNWQNDALKAHRRNKFMCALVQAIRKVGVAGSGPGLGDPKNPMHIVRTRDRPASSGVAPPDQPFHGDTSFGERAQVVKDPATEIDDDRSPTAQYEYYNPDTLERRVDEAAAEAEAEERLGAPVAQFDRGKSFGRRRKRVASDLEKGESPQ